MDLSNPWTLLSGLLLGLVGMALFIYGKKQADIKCLGAGTLLCVAPYFIASQILLWLLAAAVLGGVYMVGRE